MKLNDPFGRMERRHQVSYLAVRDSLQRGGVDTEEAALRVIKDTRMRAVIFIGGAAVITALTALIFPGALLIVGAFTLLLSAWVISWTINGKRYVKRYIEEDFGNLQKHVETETDEESAMTDNHRVSLITNTRREEPQTIAFLDDEVSKQVVEYHKTIPGYEQTPLISLDALSQLLGVKKIFVKDESHRFGLNAFKALGVSWAVGNIVYEKLGITNEALTYQNLCTEQARKILSEMTFITATDGNHGRGLAWFANNLGARAVVMMPHGSVQSRVDAIVSENAEVIVTDKNYDDTVREANQRAGQNGWITVQDTAWEGYEQIPAWITQGYMTMAREALAQIKETGEPRPTHVFLQAGVGSMAAGVLGYFVNVLGDDVSRAIVVEPNEAACMFKSAQEDDGKPHAVGGSHDTMMAGLACGEPNIEAWNILRDHACAYVSCSDSVSARGMNLLANPNGDDQTIVSGESGAVGAGLLEYLMKDGAANQMRNDLQLNEDSVILIFSTEGDTDPDNYQRIIKSG